MTTPTTPTPVAQVTATTSQVLQADIASVDGFLVTGANIETPDLGKKFNGKVSGRISASDSSITFYASATGADVRSIFTLGLAGYVAFFANGAVTGSAADYYKVTVTSVGRSRDIEAVPTLQVMFAIVDYNEGGLYPTS
jgi:hypothetical protein